MIFLFPIELSNPPNKSADFIFLHGITGDPISAWSTEVYSWFDYVKTNHPNARIITIGYDTAALNILKGSSTPDFYMLSRALIEVLDYMNVRRSPTFFFCHSQGGILLKAAISLMMTDHFAHGTIAPLLGKIAGIVFFGVPHFGASLARVGTIILPRSLSQQAIDLTGDGAFLKLLHDQFMQFVRFRSVKILNLIEKKPLFILGRIAATGIPELPESNMQVDRDHVSISKPVWREDRIVQIVDGFLLGCISGYAILAAVNQNVVIHFLDHHFLAMKQLATHRSQLTDDAIREFSLIYRFAIIFADNVVVPASCLVESPICADIFAEYKTSHGNSYSTENHATIKEYVTDTTLKTEGFYDFKPVRVDQYAGIADLALVLRSRNATQDILAGLSHLNIDVLLRDLHRLVEDRSLLRSIERNWAEVETSSVAEFVIPPTFEKYLLDGRTHPAVFVRISEIVNELYFKSFVDDFDGVIFNPRRHAYHDFKYIPLRCVVSVFDVIEEAGLGNFALQLQAMSPTAVNAFRLSEDSKPIKTRFWAAAEVHQSRIRNWLASS